MSERVINVFHGIGWLSLVGAVLSTITMALPLVTWTRFFIPHWILVAGPTAVGAFLLGVLPNGLLWLTTKSNDSRRGLTLSGISVAVVLIEVWILFALPLGSGC